MHKDNERMTDGDLQCKQLVEIITDYLEGDLPDEERERFERHLTVCVGCRNYVEQMRTTLRLVGTLSAEGLPESLQQELLATFRGLRINTGSS
jgi:anti-sigma factor RsiW